MQSTLAVTLILHELTVAYTLGMYHSVVSIARLISAQLHTCVVTFTLITVNNRCSGSALSMSCC
jgi:hypothetical protein